MDHLEFSDSDDEFFEYTEAHRHQPQNRHFNEKVFEDDLPEILRQQQVRVPEEVVNLLEVRLTNQLQYNQPRKGMLTVREQLLLFLHFVGTNSFFHVMRDVHGPSVSTVCRTVHRVASAISSLQQEVISWPSDQSSVATKFYQIAKFPRVAGAADGTHITVFPPNYQEDDFDTLPATDTMLEQMRRQPSAVRRGQAAGPIHLSGSGYGSGSSHSWD